MPHLIMSRIVIKLFCNNTFKIFKCTLSFWFCCFVCLFICLFFNYCGFEITTHLIRDDRKITLVSIGYSSGSACPSVRLSTERFKLFSQITSIGAEGAEQFPGSTVGFSHRQSWQFPKAEVADTNDVVMLLFFFWHNEKAGLLLLPLRTELWKRYYYFRGEGNVSQQQQLSAFQKTIILHQE